MVSYYESLLLSKRRKTREILVGSVGVGGNNPVRIQSMTTSNTRDVEATVDQVMRLSDVGCEIVRITVQGMKEADACEGIKNGLLKRGYTIPLVADIHFFPPAAMRAADFVDKVRINPGNYADKRASFKTIEYDDASYARELAKIEEKFTPLVEKCKKLKRAMRIGTNHGSLSDRILNRYGDTPRGMLESALEFARICRKNDYHDFLFSMKSSNPQVMISAYRLLAKEMQDLDWDYPLHLGVTEAGEGEDGRIKSAMGIGSLLLEGIGDTIRVSLTEDPWNEIDPCARLISFAKSHEEVQETPFSRNSIPSQSSEKRKIVFPKNISLHRDGTVVTSVSTKDLESPDFYKQIGCDTQLGKPKLKIASSDCLFVQEKIESKKALQTLQNLKEVGITVFSTLPQGNTTRMLSLQEAVQFRMQEKENALFSLSQAAASSLAVKIQDESIEEWPLLSTIDPAVIFLAPTKNRLSYSRAFFGFLQKQNLEIPVILHFSYTCSKEDLIIQSAAECGALFCDGLGEGICIGADFDIEFLRVLSFSILQAARKRTSKTDFISCPSCGRTLFDLQDVSKRIREKTSHLPGVKIAIMGCIVNGPGEMADADFGYVGSKPGMIDLYVGKQCVEKDISFADADGRLIELIKKHGRWVEPEKEESSLAPSLTI